MVCPILQKIVGFQPGSGESESAQHVQVSKQFSDLPIIMGSDEAHG